jgi:hypothetical protein
MYEAWKYQRRNIKLLLVQDEGYLYKVKKRNVLVGVTGGICGPRNQYGDAVQQCSIFECYTVAKEMNPFT